jgi:hypothetical protein
MRATITTATVVALLATGAGSAAARPADTPTARPADAPTTRIDADAMRGIHVDGLRYQAQAAYYRHHGNATLASKPAPAPKPGQDYRSPDARDAAAGRGTFNSPKVIVVKSQPQPAVHVTHLTDGGFDWADGAIGAGLAAALLLSAAGASALRRKHPATS